MNEKELKELRIQKKWFDKVMKAQTPKEVEKIYGEMGTEMFQKIKKNYYTFCNLESD